MTLIEIVIFLINAGFVFLVSFVSYHACAKLTHNNIFGAIAGGTAFICGIWLVVKFWRIMRVSVRKWYQVFPLRPPCRKGVCKSENYRWDMKSSSFFKGDIFVCNCGDRYIRKGCCFDEILADGSRKPYMQRYFIVRRWRKSPRA